LATRIFISYRRDDTAAVAHLLYDRLWRVFSRRAVFFDIATIGGGEDFEKRIAAEIGRSDAVLIFIGERWLGPAASSSKLRIWESNDYVRTEIREALARQIKVIPVLVSGTRMPSPEQLPDDIRAVTTRNALSLRHESFDDDTENIVSAIRGTDAPERHWDRRISVWSRIAYGFGGATLAAAFIVVGALMHFWLFDRPLAASIGTPLTVLTALATICLGGWLGTLRANARASRK
jgi:hypothetical protein